MRLRDNIDIGGTRQELCNNNDQYVKWFTEIVGQLCMNR